MHTFVTMTENTRWMIVDDDEQILLLLAAVIQRMTQAEVESYNSPQAALAAFRAAPGKYELVITDFDMPEMDGVELCRRIRAIAPGQEIFLATGSGFFTEEAAYQAGFAALLNKPFPVSALHGSGVGDMLDHVCEMLKKIDKPVKIPIAGDDSLHIAIVGRPNAGKSSLVNKICGKKKIPGNSRR